jgi:hypothetical protein
MGSGRSCWTRFLVGGLVFAAGVGVASAQVELQVVSVSPTRPHFVAAGTDTTFVVSAHNTSGGSVSTSVAITSGTPSSWPAAISGADLVFRPIGVAASQVTVTIPARETRYLVAKLTPGPSLPEGAEGTAVVKASVQGSVQSTVDVKARVRNRPKLFYVVLDGAGSGYMALDRRGNRYDGSVGRLMPRLSAFASQAALMTHTASLLPTTTDGNHAAALTGSWPGTLGLFSVKRQYLGKNSRGRSVIVDGSKSLLRWGPSGQPIQSMFDLAKDPGAGGDPAAFNALVSGKQWVADLFRDAATLDLAVGAQSFPSYVPAAQPYRVGDPPSDDDPAQDREGTNLGPWATKHLTSLQANFTGSNPKKAPEDRWVAEATIRIVAAEDPDVLYVNLAECDTIQHIFGAADRPEEWSDAGTPDILWDDENIYNPQANRDPILDTVFEADYDFGLILDLLSSRQVLDRSYVTLLSDHGAGTMRHTRTTVLDVAKILLAAGVAKGDAERMVTSGELGWMALADPSKAPQIEAILEQHEEDDPVTHARVRPFIVINRAEMDSGVDNVEGPFGLDGVAGNHRGELYSEWSINGIDNGVPRVRWPDLFTFNRFHFQNALIRSDGVSGSQTGSQFNGHHGSLGAAEVLLALRGPGIQAGPYDGASTLADLAPTLYRLLGIVAPAHVDGRVLEEVLVR